MKFKKPPKPRHALDVLVDHHHRNGRHVMTVPRATYGGRPVYAIADRTLSKVHYYLGFEEQTILVGLPQNSQPQPFLMLTRVWFEQLTFEGVMD